MPFSVETCHGASLRERHFNGISRCSIEHLDLGDPRIKTTMANQLEAAERIESVLRKQTNWKNLWFYQKLLFFIR